MSKLFNIFKLSLLSCVAASMLCASSAQAQWVLIDDFEGLTAGTTIEGTTGPGATWTGISTSLATAEADPDCATNLAMLQTGAPGNTQLRAAFSSTSTNIVAGATGTLFYRIRVPDSTVGTTDHVIGLTDNPDITNYNFKSGLRNITPAIRWMLGTVLVATSMWLLWLTTLGTTFGW